MTGCSRRAGEGDGAARHRVCDLRDGAQAARLVETLHPALVIHCQALSDVDRCEREPDEAYAQNAGTIHHLLEALQGSGARFIYVSSDYVFDGRKGSAYDEQDRPNPLSVYGKAKREGEQVALRSPGAVVARPSTLFGSGRMNFCDSIVERVRAGQPVDAFLDQVTSPTYTTDLAEGLADLGLALANAPEWTGPRIFHMVNAGSCTRAGFAHRVVELVGGSHALVREIPMASQPRPAPRPACSALTSISLHQIIGRSLRSWDEALQAYLQPRARSRVPQAGPSR